nr:unnamed protein product [Callosobruchus chinensis]
MDDQDVPCVPLATFQGAETVLEMDAYAQAEPEMQEGQGQSTAGQRREEQDQATKRHWVRVGV